MGTKAEKDSSVLYMKSLLIAFLLICLLLLNACSLPLTPAAPPSPTIVTITVTLPSYGSCGYQWAYQDLPELSFQFQQDIQNLQPEAQAKAFAFGEDCIHEDGTTKTFIPMETDFNITLQVGDLSDESALGEWIVKVMQVVENIPPDRIVGPRLGRISLGFQSGSDQKHVNFYINQFQELPSGLNNAEIYQALQTPQ